jgi:hypothetical protein
MCTDANMQYHTDVWPVQLCVIEGIFRVVRHSWEIRDRMRRFLPKVEPFLHCLSTGRQTHLEFEVPWTPSLLELVAHSD